MRRRKRLSVLAVAGVERKGVEGTVRAFEVSVRGGRALRCVKEEIKR